MKVSGLLNLKSVVGKLSVQSQSVFWYFVIPILFYGVFVAVCGYYYLESRNAPVADRIRVNASFTGEQIDRFLVERMNEIIHLSANPITQQICERTLTKSTWHSYTRNSLKTSVSYDELILCDTLGNTLATNKTDHEGNAFPEEYERQNHFGEEWFRACLVYGGPSGGAYVSDINQADYNLRRSYWGIDLAAPVKDSSGKLVGIIKVRLNWNATILAIIPERNFSNTNQDILFIFSKQGNLIAGGEKKTVLKLGKNKMNRVPEFAINNKQYSAEHYHYWWEQSNGYESFRGNAWFILSMSPRYNVSVLLSDQQFLFTIVVPGIMIVLLVTIGWWRWRYHVSRQLMQMSGHLKLMNEGKSASLSLSGSSEVRSIQSELNRLQDYLSAVEQKLIYAMEYENKEFTARSDDDSLSKGINEIVTKYLAINREMHQNHYVSKGIQEVTTILYSNEKNPALKKFCSYIHKYLNVLAMGVFFSKDGILSREASWGLMLDDNKIEQYNLLFDCMDSKKRIELHDKGGAYLKLQSGLGNARENYIYLIPMIFAQRCDGVLEIASIKPLPEEAFRFLDQCGSMLAVFWQYQLQEGTTSGQSLVVNH